MKRILATLGRRAQEFDNLPCGWRECCCSTGLFVLGETSVFHLCPAQHRKVTSGCFTNSHLADNMWTSQWLTVNYVRHWVAERKIETKLEVGWKWKGGNNTWAGAGKALRQYKAEDENTEIQSVRRKEGKASQICWANSKWSQTLMQNQKLFRWENED